MRRWWRRRPLRTQIVVLLVATILLLQGSAILIDYYFLTVEERVQAREGAADIFREVMPNLLRTPPEMRQVVADGLRRPVRVVLIEPRSGIQQGRGDRLLPELGAAIAEFLREDGVPVAEFEMAERRVLIPAVPPGLDADRPDLLDAVGDRPPALIRRNHNRDLPRWVTLSGSQSDGTGEGLDEATVYVLALRAEGETDWVNIYSLVPRVGPVEPLVLKSLQAKALLILLGGAAILILGRLMRPLQHLAEGANRLGRGERLEPIAVEGSADLRDTIAAFNQMTERVSRAVDYQIGLMQSLGHDLKTPLATIGMLARKVEVEETRQQIEGRLDAAQSIVSSIMTFTRATMRDGEVVPIDLPSLLEALAEEHEDMGHEVTADLPAGVVIRGRYNAVERVFRNLMENAVKYGRKVRVTLRQGGDEAVVNVDDSGPGIPDAMIDAVFRPFERIAQDSFGSGLGLAIVKTIVVDHGGTVTLSNRSEGGLRATVRLPV